jgi:hypothetical protein
MNCPLLVNEQSVKMIVIIFTRIDLPLRINNVESVILVFVGPKLYHLIRHCPRSRPNCMQREYLRSGGNLEPRPVPDTEWNKDNKTLNYASTPPGANILLGVRALVVNPIFNFNSVHSVKVRNISCNKNKIV